MTATLVALYSHPGDIESFDELYFETHLPLVNNMPGLKHVEIMKPQQNVMGGDVPYYLMALLTFENQDALKAALKSEAGQEAGKNLMGFASHYVTMVSAENLEVPQPAGVS